jgi:hypothetical protein
MAWMVRRLNPGRVSFSERPWTQPASCKMYTESLSRGLSGRNVTLSTHRQHAPTLKKEYNYTSAPPLSLHGFLSNLTFVETGK